MSITDDFPPIGTTDEVAKLVRCSPAQVREYVREGRLRGFLAGRSLRYTRDAVLRFIAEREAAT